MLHSDRLQPNTTNLRKSRWMRNPKKQTKTNIGRLCLAEPGSFGVQMPTQSKTIMNRDFLIGSAQLNQASESQESGGSSSMTRRSFIKRTGAVTVATMIAWQASQAPVNAEPLPHGAVSYRWILRCTEDPATSNSAVQQGSATTFITTKNTPFDPPGPGDGSNCRLSAVLIAGGPKKNDEGTAMVVEGALSGGTMVRNRWRAYFSDSSIPTMSTNKISKVKVTAKINSQTGDVTFTPQDGEQHDDSTVHWSAGPSQAHIKNLQSFTVSGFVEHDFRSAYSGSVSAEIKAEFLKVWGVAFSGELAVDVNNLGSLDCKPQDLEWTIRRIKQYLNAGGQVIHEDDLPIAQ